MVWKANRACGLREGDRVNLFAAYAHCGRRRHCATGRWILCQGEPAEPGMSSHAQFVRRRADFCLPLAADIDFDAGALLSDVLGTPYRAIQRLAVRRGETVLVLGQGPIGLAASMICAFVGATVIAADVDPSRLELSRLCGAAATVAMGTSDGAEQVQAAAGAGGVDVAIDCVGMNASRLSCLDGVRAGGRVAIIGLKQGLELDAERFSRTVFRKDLEIITSWYSNPADMVELEAMVREGLRPQRMVTHTRPLEDAAAGYAAMFGGGSGKVILRPWT